MGTRDLDVHNAGEHSEMMYHRLLVVPDLVWCLPIEASRWRPVEEVDGVGYKLVFIYLFILLHKFFVKNSC